MLYVGLVAAATFNLVCTGTVEKTNYNGSTTQPYSTTYRVDTSAQLWCKDNDQDCKTPEKFKDINAAVITFIDSTTDTPQEYFRYVDSVSRETGKHHVLMASGRGAMLRYESRKGVCEVAPFSGFPKAIQKF